MSTRISVKNADTGDMIKMDLEADNTIEEIIESACSYWEKDPGAYVVRKGKKVLMGKATIVQAEVREEDVLELIPDPEGG